MVMANLIKQPAPYIARLLQGFTSQILILTLLQFSSQLHALTVVADRTSVPLNETFTLTISSNQRGIDKLDLEPVSKNFNILSRSSQSEYSMMNGKAQSLQKLVLSLSPKQQGIFVIPPLELKNQQSKLLRIEVIDPVIPPAQLGDESIFLEATLSKPSAYVGEQLIYTLSIYYRVGLSGAELTDLAVEKAQVQALEDKSYQREINGQLYQMVEKRYALNFNEAGVHYIQGQTLTALLGQRSRSRFGFDPFVRGQEVRLAADETSIRIKSPPISDANSPINSLNDWLPAEQFVLEENWKGIENPVVGEPITRTVSLFARGLAAERLPVLPAISSGNLNSYPEKPELSNNQWHSGLAGTRKETIVYIPTSAGNIEIPAMSVNWWNTTTDSWEVAELPARTIKVLAATATGQNTEPANQIIWSSPQKAPVATDTNKIEGIAPDPASVTRSANLRAWQISNLVFLLLWLGTLLVLWRQWRRPGREKKRAPTANTSEPAESNLKSATQLLLVACKANDITDTSNRLRTWRSEVNNALRENPALKQDAEILNLLAQIDLDSCRIDQILYSNSQHREWKSDALEKNIKLLSSELQSKVALIRKVSRKNATLKPLYPEFT